jgi:hypothetical protein
MLYPVDNEFRRLTRLDGVWDFVLDPEDRGTERGWFRDFPGGARPMSL